MHFNTTLVPEEHTYAEAQWALVAKDGYRYDAGFMVSSDGFKFVPVPRGERLAAKRVSLAAAAAEAAVLQRIIAITNAMESEWLAKYLAKSQ